MKPWEEARQRLPLPNLIRQLCPNLSGKSDKQLNSVHSPLRCDKNKSFSIFAGKDGKWRWKDHGTGKSGDEVDFIMELKGLDQKKAQRRWYELAGLRIKEKSASQQEYKPNEPTDPKKSWKRKLRKPNEMELNEISKRTKLPIEGLRYADILHYLWVTEFHFQPSYAFTDSAFVALELRPLKSRHLKYGNEKSKTRTAGGFKKTWLIGSRTARNYSHWIFCEGTHDFLAAICLVVHYGIQDDTCVVCMPGKIAIPEECVGNIQGTDITIMPHLDDGGLAYANECKELFANKGAVVRIAEYQKTLDRLAEAKRVGGKRVFRRRPKGFKDLRDLMTIPNWEEELLKDGVQRLIPEHEAVDPF